eukprot:TRINITY_DN73022_c0_g1_i1.p1 TRINITY_DN73022_c0_g1~~TRINITY_DN73022_c0_g1_i1.p1  ORF type:complete len:412 (+),score=82.56 TRINITY_DN73022_c0_g1_i1:100-1335(+)
MPSSGATETDRATKKELDRLRRLPDNRVCPNCRKESDGLGFGAICVAFKTFVCSDCKSAHQSFSHRCKSAQMSVWTMDEVKALDDRNGGGNAACRRRYMARLGEGDPQPKEDSTLDAKKKFVERAYELKRWFSEVEEGHEAVSKEEPEASPASAASAAATELGSDEQRSSSGRRSRKSSRKPGERRSEHRHHQRRSRSQSEPSPTEASWTAAGSSVGFGEAFSGFGGGGPSPYSHSEPAWGASQEASPSWEQQSVYAQPAQRMADPPGRPQAYSDSWALPGGSPYGSPEQRLARSSSNQWGMPSPAASSAAPRPQASVPQTPVLPHGRPMIPQTPVLPPGRPSLASPVASPAAALAASSPAALNPTNPWAMDVMRLYNGAGSGGGAGRPNGYAVSNHERSPPWSPAAMWVH